MIVLRARLDTDFNKRSLEESHSSYSVEREGKRGSCSHLRSHSVSHSRANTADLQRFLISRASVSDTEHPQLVRKTEGEPQ
jgi:hypothetical protein